MANPKPQSRRPDARQMRGTAEGSYDEARRSPEEVGLGEEEAESSGPRRRDDLTAEPEELGARFLNDAVQGDALEDEEDAQDLREDLPLAREEDMKEHSRAQRPAPETTEGDR